jgi:hypothetical protein
MIPCHLALWQSLIFYMGSIVLTVKDLSLDLRQPNHFMYSKYVDILQLARNYVSIAEPEPHQMLNVKFCTIQFTLQERRGSRGRIIFPSPSGRQSTMKMMQLPQHFSPC